jgi:hypothetical protein
VTEIVLAEVNNGRVITERSHNGGVGDDMDSVDSLIDGFLSHGCWCSQLLAEYEGTVVGVIHAGAPIDGIDELCRNWILARQCLLEDDNDYGLCGPATIGSDVVLWDKLYTWDAEEKCEYQDEEHDALVANCLKQTCEVDAYYAVKLWATYIDIITDEPTWEFSSFLEFSQECQSTHNFFDSEDGDSASNFAHTLQLAEPQIGNGNGNGGGGGLSTGHPATTGDVCKRVVHDSVPQNQEGLNALFIETAHKTMAVSQVAGSDVISEALGLSDTDLDSLDSFDGSLDDTQIMASDIQINIG